MSMYLVLNVVVLLRAQLGRWISPLYKVEEDFIVELGKSWSLSVVESKLGFASMHSEL